MAYIPLLEPTPEMAARYAASPPWWIHQRFPWKNPWWLTKKVPDEEDYAQEGENFDFCFYRIQKSPLTMGRRILVQIPRYATSGKWESTSHLNSTIERNARIGLVLQVGVHAYPETSEVYGTLPFVYPGDWVEYAHWEKTESQYEGCIYINDLHIISVVNPGDYPTVLENMT